MNIQVHIHVTIQTIRMVTALKDFREKHTIQPPLSLTVGWGWVGVYDFWYVFLTQIRKKTIANV